MSDQHGNFPQVPPCDILLVAGDQCPDIFGGIPARVDPRRQVNWFMEDWLRWRRKQPAEMCYVTFGNHDYCGHTIMKTSHTVLDARTVAVVDGLVEVGGLKIWLTPWSSQFRDWAFMQTEERCKDLYNPIPHGLDILVSHQPMRGLCDQNGGMVRRINDKGEGVWVAEHLGSGALLDAVIAKRPKVLICGHIHGGHGQMDYLHTDLRFNSGNPKRFVTDTTKVYNVALIDERYEWVHQPTLIEIPAD